MNDGKKTKQQLLKELDEMRKLVSDMENEHLRTDELILQSVYSWEDTFNNITDMITIHDKDYNIIHANKAAEQLLDLPLLKINKTKCYKFYHGEDSPPDGCPSCECLKTKKPVAFERYEPHLNKFLEIRAMPQLDSNSDLIGVIHIVRDITERKQMEDQIISLKKHLLTGKLENEATFAPIVTRSKNMRAIFQYVESISKSSNPVFMTGETGVGKELLARSVHLASGLRGEYVAVNIAGLDDNVFSDTLFGHKKGAYTGADKEREGLIVRARGGTLLLDEIGDLSESSQVKLLRLLEDRSYYPLGADTPVKSDVRIIACSNRNIERMIKDGGFRKDLYYRLRTHHVHIPPLRDRMEDIPLLLDHFISEAAKSLKKKKPSVPNELVILLSTYHFPGNIRELKAMVHDAVAMHKTGTLSMESFKEAIKQTSQAVKSGASSANADASSLENLFGHFPGLKEIDDYLVSEALRRSDGNQGIAASLLGITRQALNQRLKKKNKPS